MGSCTISMYHMKRLAYAVCTYSYVSFRLLTEKKVPGYLGLFRLAGRFSGYGTWVLSEKNDGPIMVPNFQYQVLHTMSYPLKGTLFVL